MTAIVICFSLIAITAIICYCCYRVERLDKIIEVDDYRREVDHYFLTIRDELKRLNEKIRK